MANGLMPARRFFQPQTGAFVLRYGGWAGSGVFGRCERSRERIAALHLSLQAAAVSAGKIGNVRARGEIDDAETEAVGRAEGW